MDAEHIPGAILLVLIFAVVAMGLWYAGVRWNSLRAKQIAVMVGVFPVLGFGLQFAAGWFDWNSRPEYHTTVVGPPSREAMATTEIPVPVNNAEVEHQIELTPEIRGANPPREPLHLRFKLRSPKGEILAAGEQDLSPGQKLRWMPLRAQFQPHEEGEHTLTLDIPQPASSVDVRVREIRK